MPNILQHQSAHTTKLLLVGDSGVGKTGALMSLAAAGYKLRIIDFDNGVDILRGYCTDEKSPYLKLNPKVAENIVFETLADPMKNLNGKLVPAKAQAWARMTGLLQHWKGEGYDLGPVASWDTDCVLVIDSLSMACDAAMNYHLAINGALGATRTQNEGRRDIGQVQNMIRELLKLLYEQSIRCNVIVMAHITMVDEMGGRPEGEASGPIRGYPSAVGRALSPHIPRWFNTVLYANVVGTGPGARHRIYTRSQGYVNVKTSAPLKVAPEYPLETGLADYFKAVRS